MKEFLAVLLIVLFVSFLSLLMKNLADSAQSVPITVKPTPTIVVQKPTFVEPTPTFFETRPIEETNDDTMQVQYGYNIMKGSFGLGYGSHGINYISF